MENFISITIFAAPRALSHLEKKKRCCPYLMMNDVTRYDSIAFQFMARVIRMNRYEKVVRKEARIRRRTRRRSRKVG
jgi:hypothetical protein